MRKLLILFIVLILIASCISKKHTTVEGDMFFQMVDLFRIYDAPDSLLNNIEKEYSQINYDTIPKDARKFYKLVKYAIDQKLLRTPHLWMETSKGKKVMLFMDKISFEQFDSLKCFDLKKQKKKIHIIAKAQPIPYKDLDVTAYKMIELIKAERIEGETNCRK